MKPLINAILILAIVSCIPTPGELYALSSLFFLNLMLQPTHSVRDIAEKVKRSVEFVRRMIDVHVQKEVNNRHAQRVNAVQQLSNSQDIPASVACARLGLSYNAYCYSARRIGLHGHKKAHQ